MTERKAIPVIIGVGDIVNRSLNVEDAIEPLQLMLQAIRMAIDDTGLSQSSIKSLQSTIDSIDVVQTWTWPYPDLPGLLAHALEAQVQHKSYSEHGGNQSAKLLDEAARRISMRKSRVAVITGGEALASCKFSHIVSTSTTTAKGAFHTSSDRLCKGKTIASSGVDKGRSISQISLLPYKQRTAAGSWCCSSDWCSHPRLPALRERLQSTSRTINCTKHQRVRTIVYRLCSSSREESIRMEPWQASGNGRVDCYSIEEEPNDLLSM